MDNRFCDVAAVSYTHLDVYKGQGSDGLKVFSILSVISKERLSIILYRCLRFIKALAAGSLKTAVFSLF